MLLNSALDYLRFFSQHLGLSGPSKEKKRERKKKKKGKIADLQGVFKEFLQAKLWKLCVYYTWKSPLLMSMPVHTLTMQSLFTVFNSKNICCFAIFANNFVYVLLTVDNGSDGVHPRLLLFSLDFCENPVVIPGISFWLQKLIVKLVIIFVFIVDKVSEGNILQLQILFTNVGDFLRVQEPLELDIFERCVVLYSILGERF